MTAHRPRVVIMLVAAVCLFAQSTAPAHAAAVTSPSACSPVSGTKPLIRGLVDRGAVPPATDLQASSVNVDWSALEPSGPGLVANNPIDQAIAAAGCTPLRIRVLAGIATPAWVLADTGSVSVTNPYSDTPGTAGLFWTSEYAYWYDNLESELAAKYDSVPNVDEFVVSRCALFYPEPFILGTSIASNDTALLAAGYTESADQQCLLEEIDTAAQDWHTTRIGVSFNPYQTLAAASNSNGYTTGVDEAYTEQVMAYCRNELGPRCVLENDSIRDPISSLTSQYTQMYSAMTGASGPIDLTLNNLNVSVTLGAPIAFQTATATNIGDFWGTLEWARENHASSVELPLDGTYPTAGGAGAPAWQTLGEVAQWFEDVPTITPTPVNAIQGTTTAGDVVATLTLDELAADDTLAGYGDVGSVPFDTVTASITWPGPVTRPGLVSLGQGSPMSSVTCAAQPMCTVTIYSDGYTFPNVITGTATVAVTLATGGVAYTPADGVDIVASVPVTVTSSRPALITSVAPAAGPVSGGQLVTVTGSGFSPGMSVTIGGTSVTPSSITFSSFKFVTPPDAAGYAQVQVSTSLGVSPLTANAGYIYAALGNYVPLTPFRILDTRVSSCVQCESGAITAGATRILQITGVTGLKSGVDPIPSTATAVVLNVTEVAGSESSLLTVYPNGTARPNASNLNFKPGTVTPNLVTAVLGESGASDPNREVNIFNAVGTVNVLADVEGYFEPQASGDVTGAFHPITPLRVCDTRSSEPVTVCAGRGALGAGRAMAVNVTSSGAIPGNGTAEAAVLNVTGVAGSAGTYLSVYPTTGSGGCSAPPVSTLNLTGGSIEANRVIVALGPATQGGADTSVCVYNSLGTINVLLDANGWFGSATGPVGYQYQAIGPSRICDTRPESGLPCAGHPIGSPASALVEVDGVNGVPAFGGSAPAVQAVVANLTAIAPTAGTFLTLYPANQPRPNVSDLNVPAGTILGNLAIVEVDGTPGPAEGDVTLYNSAGTVNVVVDVEGWFQ
jgi:hypothetical protein